MHCETYSPLEYPFFRHRFVGRVPHIDVAGSKDAVMERLRPIHEQEVTSLFGKPTRFVTAEQVHRDDIAVVGADTASCFYEGIDGLITSKTDMAIGIAVADCCAVTLLDPEHKAFAILHSGKKGSELGITTKAISLMKTHFETKPQQLIAQLSPCIRPPLYEIDFAAMIRKQCADAGIPNNQIFDQGRCTGKDLEAYYSYRIEKGVTGRMMALGGIVNG